MSVVVFISFYYCTEPLYINSCVYTIVNFLSRFEELLGVRSNPWIPTYKHSGKNIYIWLKGESILAFLMQQSNGFFEETKGQDGGKTNVWILGRPGPRYGSSNHVWITTRDPGSVTYGGMIRKFCLSSQVIHYYRVK